MQLSYLQEFLVYLILIRTNLDKRVLASKFYGSTDDYACTQMVSLLRTWACALHEMLQAETWWLDPGNKSRINSTAFDNEMGKDVLGTADCTSFAVQGSNTTELVGQQLFVLEV